ncbi:MAG TPA: tRNA-binding protein [Gemmatimonadales bacterium]|nr:tRNA-binding protein [Gemmatimonadales bacterium]
MPTSGALHSWPFRAWLTSAEDTCDFPRPVFQGRNVDQITWDDFAKVEIRVGRIIEATDFPNARKPAYRLKIDFGELGVKSSSAQITKYYRRDELVGRQVLAVVNFPPRQIANFFSEVLTLGVVQGEGDIVLIGPDREVPLGLRIA